MAAKTHEIAGSESQRDESSCKLKTLKRRRIGRAESISRWKKIQYFIWLVLKKQQQQRTHTKEGFVSSASAEFMQIKCAAKTRSCGWTRITSRGCCGRLYWCWGYSGEGRSASHWPSSLKETFISSSGDEEMQWRRQRQMSSARLHSSPHCHQLHCFCVATNGQNAQCHKIASFNLCSFHVPFVSIDLAVVSLLSILASSKMSPFVAVWVLFRLHTVQKESLPFSMYNEVTSSELVDILVTLTSTVPYVLQPAKMEQSN